MSFIVKLIQIVLVSVLALLAVMLFRAEVYFPTPKHVETCNQTHEPIAGPELIERFAKAIQIPTITKGERNYDKEALIRFAAFLKNTFPRIYSSPFVTVQTINNYSLLYTVKGSDPTLKPYLLCSHQDVVPVVPKNWDVDPFGGVIKDGYIYGRGTIDVKNTLMSIMESLDYLLKTGFKPRRSFYIAFGHDEEGLGVDGAQEIGKYLEKIGANDLEFLLDEGSVIFDNLIAGISKKTAVISVTEKGCLTVRIKAKGPVGHSSLAPIETSIIRLARAVSKLTADSHPNLFGLGPEKDMFESFAEHAAYPYKLVYSNLWFFGPFLSRALTTNPMANGLVRTTSAVTIVNGGFKENVLPMEAEAIVNHRIHPMNTIEDVLKFDKDLINDDNVEVSIYKTFVKAHPISSYSTDSFGFQTIKTSIGQVFEDMIIMPGIMLATTDTKWYLNLTKSVYRFSPSVMMTLEDTRRFHGHNERISIENYLKTVNFYHHIMLNSDESKLKPPTNVKDEL